MDNIEALNYNINLMTKSQKFDVLVFHILQFQANTVVLLIF